MNWTELYISPSALHWQGRKDLPTASCFYQHIQMLDLKKPINNFDKPTFALIGFKCDEGIKRNFGREGAAQAPEILREVLAKFSMQRTEINICDAGDIVCKENNLEAAQLALAESVYQLLKNKIIPIVIGGGHELAWGHYQGIAKQYPKQNLGIVNFDAHFDMRPLLSEDKGSSGTPFLQIAQAHEINNRRLNYNCIGIQPTGNIPLLFATAKKYQTKFIFADEIQLANTQSQNQTPINLINTVIEDNEIIYVSLCLDVFASAYSPGVSAPQVLGLTPWQVIPSLRKLCESGKVISYDIAELSPQYDIDLRTTKLAANLIYEIIHHHKI